MTEATDARRNSAVIDAVKAGEFARIPGMLREGELSDARREALLERLDSMSGPWPVFGERAVRVHYAMALVRIACRRNAEEVVSVLGGAHWLPHEARFGDAFLDVFADWPPDDLNALAHALRPPSNFLLLVNALVEKTRMPYDIDDEDAVDWFLHTSGREDTPEAAADALRASPLAPFALPRLPDTEGLGRGLAHNVTTRGSTGIAALAILARDGHVDRSRLLRAALQGPLRSEPRTVTPGYLALLAALEPTLDEQTAAADTLLALATSAASTAAAKDALARLRNLADLKRLTDQQVEECILGLLARPEGVMASQALTFLQRETRRSPARLGALAPLLGAAFSHPTRGVQEKAAKLTGKLADKLDQGTLDDLRAAAVQLPPDLRRQMDGLAVGPAVEAQSDAPRTDTLPQPAPTPAFPPPVSGVAEVAAELGAVLADRVGRPVFFERVLDGLVRLAYQDREALAEALEPVLHTFEQRGRTPSYLTRIWLVAMAVSGRTHDDAAPYVCYRSCGHQVFDDVLAARVDEAAGRILDGTCPPFLLAIPTHATGSLDPRVLLERLAEYRRSGVRPGEADFEQALFRLRPDPGLPPAAAEELGTPEGHRLARWLSAGGFPAPVCERTTVLPFERPDDPEAAAAYPKGWNLAAREKADWQWWDANPSGLSYHSDPPPWRGEPLGTYGARDREPAFIRLAVADATDRLAEFSAPFRAVGGPREAWQDHCNWGWGESTPWRWMFPLWLTVVPHHRELVAARTLTAMALGAEHDDRSAAVHLPALADTDGEAGPAVHLALAYGSGASSVIERTATADALLTLAGRGELDPARLARDIADLIDLDALKLKRVAETLRNVAQGGAPITVYSVLAQALPAVLPQPGTKPRAGLADLLFLAAEQAESTPGLPPIPAVSTLSEQRGSSQLLKAARWLHNATSDSRPT
ncbi:DUF6493 family protein [Streptomyces sp. NPDC093099]|uniref:DUF7824 domain-containing protein n=1 Tax=Streptomyces sp. NPDC093099 TaxID=3366028 RepID=UPI0037F2D0CC